jgi:anti-anti-sigma factor
MREALFTACNGGPSRIVVDLSEVEFMDSTALGVLIEARTKLPNRKAFLLAAPGLGTQRALHISGLDRHFTVYESVDEALAAQI